MTFSNSIVKFHCQGKTSLNDISFLSDKQHDYIYDAKTDKLLHVRNILEDSVAAYMCQVIVLSRLIIREDLEVVQVLILVFLEH